VVFSVIETYTIGLGEGTINSGTINSGTINSGTYFSSNNPSNNSNSGSIPNNNSSSNSNNNSTGSSSTSRPLSEQELTDLRARTIVTLPQARNRYINSLQAQERALNEGRAFADSHSPNQPRLIQMVQIANNAPETQHRIELAEARERENRQRLIGQRTRENANLLRELSTSNNPNTFVPDPSGIGVRGYIHGGTNQPYASEIANELVNQNVVGRTSIPNMNLDANRFLASALPHLRPNVFGANPGVSGNTSMVTRDVIRALRNMR